MQIMDNRRLAINLSMSPIQIDPSLTSACGEEKRNVVTFEVFCCDIIVLMIPSCSCLAQISSRCIAPIEPDEFFEFIFIFST